MVGRTFVGAGPGKVWVWRESGLGHAEALLGERVGDVEAVEAGRPLVFLDAGVQRLVHFVEGEVRKGGGELGAQRGRGGVVVPGARGVSRVFGHVPVAAGDDMGPGVQTA